MLSSQVPAQKPDNLTKSEPSRVGALHGRACRTSQLAPVQPAVQRQVPASWSQRPRWLHCCWQACLGGGGGASSSGTCSQTLRHVSADELLGRRYRQDSEVCAKEGNFFMRVIDGRTSIAASTFDYMVLPTAVTAWCLKRAAVRWLGLQDCAIAQQVLGFARDRKETLT